MIRLINHSCVCMSRCPFRNNLCYPSSHELDHVGNHTTNGYFKAGFCQFKKPSSNIKQESCSDSIAVIPLSWLIVENRTTTVYELVDSRRKASSHRKHLHSELGVLNSIIPQRHAEQEKKPQVKQFRDSRDEDKTSEMGRIRVSLQQQQSLMEESSETNRKQY